MSTYITASLVSLVLWSIVCRVNAMDRLTMNRVFLQHLVLGVCVFSALFVPAQWAAVCVLAGLALFLAISAHRWKHGAPPETRRGETQPPEEKP